MKRIILTLAILLCAITAHAQISSPYARRVAPSPALPNGVKHDVVYDDATDTVSICTATTCSSSGTGWKTFLVSTAGGAGVAGKLPKWTGAASLGNSSISDDGTVISSTEPIQAPLRDNGGAEYNAANYASLSAAISAIGSTPATLTISTPQTVSLNLTIPITLHLRTTGSGLITVATGVTVNDNGPFDAPLLQVFTLQGTGQWKFGAAATEKVYPQWWGARADYQNISGASVTASNTTLTETGSPFVAGDAGKKILVKNAGTPTILTGSITSGTNSLTITTSSFKQSDVGHILDVAGASLPAGTTIATYQSPTRVTLSQNAGATVSGAVVTKYEDLSTTIASFTNSNHVVLTDAPSQTLASTPIHWGTDNATPINQAAQAINYNSGTRMNAILQLPSGQYMTGSTILLGNTNTRSTGMTFAGAGRGTTQILYAGPTSTAAVELYTPHQGVVRDLRITGLTKGQAGLWYQALDNTSGWNPHTENIYLDNFSYGFVIGAGTYNQMTNVAGAAYTATGEVNQGTHVSLYITGCDEPVRTVGANVEKQTFINLFVLGEPSVMVHGYNMRGLDLLSGEASINKTSIDAPYLIHTEGGTIDGGGFSASNLRIEGLAGVAYFENGNGVANSQNLPINFKASNIVAGSPPQGITTTGPFDIVRLAGAGSITVTDSIFSADKSRVWIEGFTNAKRVSVILMNNRVNNANAETNLQGRTNSATDSLVYVSGSGSGTTGTVQATLVGNEIVNSTPAYASIGRIADRTIKYTADSVGASTFTQINDFAPAYVTLTDGATITWTFSPDQKTSQAKVTLAGNRTLAMSGILAGSTGTLIVTQDGTGSRTLTLPAGSKVISGGAGTITLSTAAGAIDVLSFTYDGTNYFWSYGKNYN